MDNSATAPEKRRFFYGWVIVAVALDSFFVHTLLMTIGFTVFLKPMAKDLDTSRSWIVGAVAMGGIVAALSAPPLGRLVDRYGPKPVMVLSALLAGASLAGLAAITSVWQLYLLYGLGTSLARPGLCQLTAPTAIANWFLRKRGRAYAVAATGLPLAAMILIPLIQLVISNWGWRAGWLAMAGIVWAMLVVPPALLLRDRPEDIGQHPDGEPLLPVSTVPLRAERAERHGQSDDWAPGAVLRSRTFWLITATISFIAFAQGSMTTHMVPYFTDRGVSDAVAVSAVTAWGAASLAAKALWGYIAERHGVQRSLQVLTVALTAGVFLAIPASTVWSIFLAAVVMGLGSGGMTQLFAQVWPDYFGRQAQGTIRGWGYLFMEPAGAGGPLLAAWIFDVRGSYHAAFWLFAALLLVGTVLMTLVPPPGRLSRTVREEKTPPIREIETAD